MPLKDLTFDRPYTSHRSFRKYRTASRTRSKSPKSNEQAARIAALHAKTEALIGPSFNKSFSEIEVINGLP